MLAVLGEGLLAVLLALGQSSHPVCRLDERVNIEPPDITSMLSMFSAS